MQDDDHAGAGRLAGAGWTAREPAPYVDLASRERAAHPVVLISGRPVFRGVIFAQLPSWQDDMHVRVIPEGMFDIRSSL